MKKNIISLHGSYFGNNYGDILLVNMFVKWIKDFDSNIIINMPLGQKTASKDLKYDITGIKNLFKSKVLIFCGGGYFGEQPNNPSKWALRNFKRHVLLGLLAILLRIPYAIIGIEFGPISVFWFRKLCIFLVKHAKIIVVRNQQSLDFLVANGVTNAILSADAVLTLSDSSLIVNSNNPIKHILFHFNGYKGDSSKIYDIIDSLVDSLSRKFEEFDLTFISDSVGPCYEHSLYHSAFSMLQSRNINYSIKHYEDCDSLIKIINNSDYIITTKLHVGITGIALNKNVLSLWLHNKTPRLHKQVGNMENCVEFKVFLENTKEIFDKFFSQKNFCLEQTVKKMANINRVELNKFLNEYYIK